MTKNGIKRKWLALLNERHLYCVLCGHLILSKKQLSLEHYVPKSRSENADNIFNIYPAHRLCNKIKGNLLPGEWHREKKKRMLYALNNWKLTSKERRLLFYILKEMNYER